ncbi:hypothetical protein LX32DRAFT_153197 [Colletotrichum zoysiae]|uniref:Transmembrane protein n=1 Tax=Colletotrichum zoysiae TaxID=1216348 RepID=A0AAD9MAI7_9PEZI|nr:hypothetical protein LX32DRAFT_153197 [Colletotrichum zoysiae]
MLASSGSCLAPWQASRTLLFPRNPPSHLSSRACAFRQPKTQEEMGSCGRDAACGVREGGRMCGLREVTKPGGFAVRPLLLGGFFIIFNPAILSYLPLIHLPLCLSVSLFLSLFPSVSPSRFVTPRSP